MVASAQRARKESAGARVRDRCPQVLALLAALCAALAFLVGACAPPAQRATGTEGPALYVANGLDRTISRIERDNGRALGAPVSVPGVPAQVVAAGDIFVVLATDERGHQPRLISFSRHGSGWATHTWALEARAEAVLLAGAGPRYAVAAYRVGSPAAGADEAPVGNTRSTGDSAPDAGPCRLALIDLASGTFTTSTLPAATCGAGDSIRSLAAEPGAQGAVAYLGLWRWPVEPPERAPFGSGRIVRVGLTMTGITEQSVLPLEGAAERLILGRAPDRPGHRLHAMEMVPGPQHAASALARGEEYAPPGAWRLLGLDPDTLRSETVIPLRQAPIALAPAPDGRRAHALVPQESRPPSTDLIEVDLVSGSARRLAALPGLSLAIAATADRIYATRSDGDQVWVTDARTGRPARTIAAGRHPLGLALPASPAALQ